MPTMIVGGIYLMFRLLMTLVMLPLMMLMPMMLLPVVPGDLHVGEKRDVHVSFPRTYEHGQSSLYRAVKFHRFRVKR